MRMVWSRWGGSFALVTISSFFLGSLLSVAFAQSTVKRQVIGTLHTHNDVEIAESTGAWRTPRAGSSLVENTFIRTGNEGAGLLDLGQNGVIGLYPKSRLFLGTLIGGALPAGLEVGELAFRLPKASKLEVRTANAIVRPSGIVGVGTSEGFLEGFVTITGEGETSVRVQNGSALVRGIEGTDFLPVKAGQEARIGGGSSEPKIVQATATALGHDPASDDRSGEPPSKRKRALAYVFTESPELAALAGGVGIVGGTLGGLAGAGIFDGNDNEGSEFE